MANHACGSISCRDTSLCLFSEAFPFLARGVKSAFCAHNVPSFPLSSRQGGTVATGPVLIGYTSITYKTLEYVAMRCLRFQELPPALLCYASKKRLINIANRDDRCFLHCILAHLAPQETNPESRDRTTNTSSRTLAA